MKFAQYPKHLKDLDIATQQINQRKGNIPTGQYSVGMMDMFIHLLWVVSVRINLD